MSVEDLANCLKAHGFVARVRTIEDIEDDAEYDEMTQADLARYISHIEDFFEWPFAEQQREEFVIYCVLCLGPEASEDLARGMAEDIALTKLLEGE
jgi:hypothetical protein